MDSYCIIGEAKLPYEGWNIQPPKVEEKWKKVEKLEEGSLKTEDGRWETEDGRRKTGDGRLEDRETGSY